MNHLEDATITSVTPHDGYVEYVLTGVLAGKSIRYAVEVETNGSVDITETQVEYHFPTEDDAPEYYTLHGIRVEAESVQAASRTARELVARAHNYIAAHREQAVRDVLDGKYN